MFRLVSQSRQDRSRPPTLLTALLIITVAVLVQADQLSAALPPTVSQDDSDYPDEAHLKIAVDETLIEPADAVLINPRATKWRRYLKDALHLPEWIDVGLEQRIRYEVYDHPWRANQAIGGGRTDPQISHQSRLRVGLGNGPLRFLFEGHDARSYWNHDPGDFRDITAANQWEVLQLFGSLTFKDVLGTGLRTDLHFGRMTLDFGSRRFIARNDFRNASNTFNGIHWQIGRGQAWRFRTFLVESVVRDVEKFEQQKSDSLFWGAQAESLHLPWFIISAYYFGLNDKSPPDPSNHRTFTTTGLRVGKLSKPGEWDYDLVTSWQTGSLGDRNHVAHFQHAGVGYTFDFPWAPRVQLHYDYASGDRNPEDGRSQRFDSLFGARRFELMPTGNFGPFFRTNISSPGWRISIHPAKGWRIQLKQRFWYLAQSRDSFGRSGLQDTTGGAGNYLGHDLEFRVQWVINLNLDFDAGYVRWFKGSYFDRLPASANLPPGGNKDTDFFYLAMRFRL